MRNAVSTQRGYIKLIPSSESCGVPKREALKERRVATYCAAQKGKNKRAAIVHIGIARVHKVTCVDEVAV